MTPFLEQRGFPPEVRSLSSKAPLPLPSWDTVKACELNCMTPQAALSLSLSLSLLCAQLSTSPCGSLLKRSGHYELYRRGDEAWLEEFFDFAGVPRAARGVVFVLACASVGVLVCSVRTCCVAM